MGSSSSKFRKHLQHGDEYAALQLYNNNSDLRKALDPNLSYGESYCHDTPLHFAARHAMKSLLRIFLYELGGNPNKKNTRNETSLHSVCMVANTRSFTVQQRRLECLTLILQWRGATLKEGDVEKIDIGAQDEKMNTALHYAAASGLTRCVELLVAYQGPLFVENAQRQTPCDCAEKCTHSNIALYLESKMVFSNDNNGEQDEDIDALIDEINNQEAYSGLRAQDLQEAKDQLLVETSDMLRVPLFTAEALLRNYEWSREQLLEAWMEDAIACCEKCGVTPPPSIFVEKPGLSELHHAELSLQNRSMGHMEIVCDICASLIPGTEEPVDMSCDHQFCRGCWERYLNGKIQEGEIHNIMCPAFDCGKLVPVELIETVVSRDMARRYLQFDIKAFVDSNPNIKWCPYPACGRAVRLPENETTSPTGITGMRMSGDTSHAVDCGNGHYFCWECLGDAHEPCSCEHWNKWFEKIQEVKPEELTNTEEETEHAANYLWLVTNSKPCPNCKSPIQKNEGCNHMKCSKCKHDFCWVCLEAWKKHSSATGGYFRCNRYEVVKRNEEDSCELKSEAEAKNRRMQELNRFMHYYSRYKNHEHSYKLEEPLLSTAKEKMMILARAVTDPETANTETKFVEDAVRQLLKARRVLKCSYIYGFYLDDSGYKKTIFEFMQTELEECLESLSQMIARPYLRTPRGRIIQTSNLVQRKRHEFVTAISKGLIPPDTSPNFRKKRRKDLDEDLRKALLASIQDIDPNNPWVKDKSGRHTNVAAYLDWPVDDSEDDSDSEQLGTPPASAMVGGCVRRGCMKPRAQNPRTGAPHDHCSLRCMKLDRLDRSESEGDSDKNSPSHQDADPAEYFTDYQMDLLRAMEMSRLQFIREMGGISAALPGQLPAPVDEPTPLPPTPPTGAKDFLEAGPSMTPGGKSPKQRPRSVEEQLEEMDTDFQRALILSRLSMIAEPTPAPPEEDKELKLAIELSLKETPDGETDQSKQSDISCDLPKVPTDVIESCNNAKIRASGVKSSNKNNECVVDQSPDTNLCIRAPRLARTPSPMFEGEKSDYLGACGGATGGYEPNQSPSQKLLSMEPSAMLETSFVPSAIGSSQFGPIKDLSVANISSSDRDKTEDFKNKTFSDIFARNERNSGKSVNLTSENQIRRSKEKEPRSVCPEQISLKFDNVGKKNKNEAVTLRRQRKEEDKHQMLYRRHSTSHAEDQGKSNIGRQRYSDLSEGSLHCTPRRTQQTKGREWKCYSYTGYEPDTSDIWVPRVDSNRMPPPPPPPPPQAKAAHKESNVEAMLKKLILPQDDENEVFYDMSNKDGATIVEQWDHSPQRSPRTRSPRPPSMSRRRSHDDDDDDSDNFPGAVFV
ncbi:ankyrin repeat and IBR domain-containing protein 1-like isoform X2 [Lineus longissimus]|uniref:ankyrin repeat and IBR domain-containing protein 1-like isoform X2 n=1 Tax=Lineus longissimus TaxID=88925 RepID=UPI00315D7246